MNEQARLDFLTAFGEEFCEALAPWVGWDNIASQDAFEVFLRVFGQEPTFSILSSLSDGQLEELRVGSEQYFESRGIAIEQIRIAVARTLTRFQES
jgi:hypothetical protein